MLPVVQIGPLVLQTPGLILILGVWLGMIAIERFAKKNQRDVNHLSNLVLWMLAAGILGARLSYAAANAPAFAGNWKSLFSLTPTMLDPFGGFMVSIITGLIYGQKAKLNPWTTLDDLTPGLAVMMVFIGLSNLASGRGYGIPSDLPWSVKLWGESRHPAQIYAILFALGLGVVYYLQQKRTPWPAGVLFLTWLSLTALARILLEPFIANSTTLTGGLRSAQVAALLILAGALILLGKRLNQPLTNGAAPTAEVPTGGID